MESVRLTQSAVDTAGRTVATLSGCPCRALTKRCGSSVPTWAARSLSGLWLVEQGPVQHQTQCVDQAASQPLQDRSGTEVAVAWSIAARQAHLVAAQLPNKARLVPSNNLTLLNRRARTLLYTYRIRH